MIYEAQSRDTISDSLKIGCVVVGMCQSSMREHHLLSVTKSDSWTNFVREVESIEHAKNYIRLISRKLLQVRKIRTHCERVSELEPWRGRRASVCAVWKKNIMDSVGHGATRHPTKIHRKEDGKVTEQEIAREPRRVASPQEEKKGKGKKEQRLNEITEPREEQWTDGSWEQWSDQSWHTEADTASWREDHWYTADSSAQASAAAEEFQHASFGELRLSNFGFAKHIESFFFSAPIGLFTANHHIWY